MSLKSAAKNVLKQCMGLKKNEALLIVADENKLDLAEEFFKEGANITKQICLLETPVEKVNGEEPPNYVAKTMLHYDVILLVTTKSLSHTNARREAKKSGARIASMPGLTADMMERTLNADYNVIKRLSKRLWKVLQKSRTLRITTKLGTDITMKTTPRMIFHDSGIYTKTHSFGNLPAGESGGAPVEGSSNGVFIVDATMAGLGKVKKPLKITVKNGFMTKAEGPDAKKLMDIVKKHGKKARNIAEYAIGTNAKAKITGITLEDEKVFGTAHIAIGNNMSYGGTVDVPLHLDGVFTKPSIWAGKRKIMENGKLLI